MSPQTKLPAAKESNSQEKACEIAGKESHSKDISGDCFQSEKAENKMTAQVSNSPPLYNV